MQADLMLLEDCKERQEEEDSIEIYSGLDGDFGSLDSLIVIS